MFPLPYEDRGSVCDVTLTRMHKPECQDGLTFESWYDIFWDIVWRRGGGICSMMESMWFQHPPIQWSWSPRSQVSVALQVPSKNRVKEDKSRTDFFLTLSWPENYSSQPSQSGRSTKHPTRPTSTFQSPSIHNLSVVSGFTKFWPLMTALLLITCNTAMNVLIVFIVWM